MNVFTSLYELTHRCKIHLPANLAFVTKTSKMGDSPIHYGVDAEGDAKTAKPLVENEASRSPSAAASLQDIPSLFSKRLANAENRDAAASALADSIYDIGNRSHEKEHLGNMLDQLWMSLLDFVQELDPLSQEHDILAQALNDIRNRDSTAVMILQVWFSWSHRTRFCMVVNVLLQAGFDMGPWDLWKDLPLLGQYLRDRWIGGSWPNEKLKNTGR